MKNALVVDDHSLVRFGLRVAIERNYPDCQIDEGWDKNSAIAQLKQHHYDLVMLDLTMPHSDPGELLHWIRNFSKETKVLIVSMNDERMFAKWCLQSGANGYIEKDASPEELARAIGMVMSGKRYMSSALAEIFINETITHGKSNPFDQLSKREYQVAMYLVLDYSNNQISDQLNVQGTSISTLRRRVFDKLGIASNKELAQLANLYITGKTGL